MPILLTYRQIADDMAVRISTGEYAPGAKLPTYAELAAIYSVSITTAARAYAVLVDREVVVGMTGRGMFAPD